MKNLIALSVFILALVAISAATDAAWCRAQTNCKACAKGVTCVWCKASDGFPIEGCYHGQFWGKVDGLPNGESKCKSWYWAQCAIPGLIFLILVAAGSGIVLILLTCCICCCCCCKRKPKGTDYALLPQSERYVSANTSSSQYSTNTASSDRYSAHPKTDARRREFEEKYSKYSAPPQSYY